MIAQKKQPIQLRWILLLVSLAFILPGTVKAPETAAASGAQAVAPAIVLSPATALANQTITVTGSGFTQGGGATVSSITVLGIPLAVEKISGGSIVTVDSAGNFFATLVLPVTSPVLLHGGHSVVVKDSQGLQAAASVTIPEPTLSLSPALSRAGSTVTVTGSNYPVASTRTGADAAPKVNIEYTVAGASPVRVATAVPDSAGKISASFQVPRDAAAGSIDNAVTATAAGTLIKGTAKHSLLAALVTISPASGPPESVAQLRGSNLRPFMPVTTLTMGSLRLSLVTSVHTNADGSFTGLFVVPLLENGAYAVLVGVDDQQYLAKFTVTGAVLPEAEPPPVTPEIPNSVDLGRALQPMGDNLVRVFHFDNTTKRWAYYDPRPAFASLNTASRLVEGQAYWVAVKADQSAMTGDKVRTFYRGWNLIAW